MPGSRKGIPNKVTQTVREVVAQFAEANAPLMDKWLRQVAEGIPPTSDEDGTPIQGTGTKANPGMALDLYLRALEYHVPKLARSEMTGADGAPLLAVPLINLTLTK